MTEELRFKNNCSVKGSKASLEEYAVKLQEAGYRPDSDIRAYEQVPYGEWVKGSDYIISYQDGTYMFCNHGGALTEPFQLPIKLKAALKAATEPY